MKKLFLSATAIATVMSVSAFAADLPSIKSAPATAPVPLWTGFYAGLNAGYGFGTANNAQNYGWSNRFPTGLLPTQAAFAASYSYMGRNIAQGGFIGGGQVGYNYQHGQSIVLGFEADMQGSGISGEGNANGWAPYSQSSSFVTRMPIQAGISWMGTARGRFGYLITPSVIAYATGGLAYGGTYLKTFPQQNIASTSGLADAGYISTQNAQQNFNVGWTAGGGAEWMMAPNWSIKGEALYYDLGNTSVSNVTYLGGNAGPNVTPLVGNAGRNPVGGSTTRAYYQGVIARAGVNYHFNLGSMPATLASSALTADLPSIKSAPAAPAPLWTGFYAGLNAGYGFGTANNAQNYGWSNRFPTGLLPTQAAFAASYSYMGRNIAQGGFIGGGQVGYNYQHGQSIVLGFEADMQGSGISGEGNANGWAPYSQSSSFVTRMPIQAGISWMGTARGRFGYLITPSVIAYATGGLAYGGTYLKTFPQQNIASTSGLADAGYISTQNAQQNFNVGWTAGGGAEWMMAPNWSIKGEALYYDLGNTSVSNVTYLGGNAGPNVTPLVGNAGRNPVGGSTTRAYYQGVIARAGVNYHFNFANVAPVVAKF